VEQQIWVRIPEMEMAVVFNQETGAFARFLLPGRHLVKFPLERITAVISLAPGSVSGKCPGAQSDGGIPINVRWKVVYVLNPARMKPELRPRLARSLPDHLDDLLRSHVGNCVQRLINEQTVEALSGGGVQKRLERELRERVVERVAPFGIQIFRTMLTSIELPPGVQTTLEKAHEREVYAASEARSLERLQQAVSRFSDDEMARLLKLKELHELGQHGVAMPIWPTVLAGDYQRAPRAAEAPPVREEEGEGNGRSFTVPPTPATEQEPISGEWPHLH
jgi:regulator of protease activity HflC (stomatin/prohibitin superfamily)